MFVFATKCASNRRSDNRTTADAVVPGDGCKDFVVFSPKDLTAPSAKTRFILWGFAIYCRHKIAGRQCQCSARLKSFFDRDWIDGAGWRAESDLREWIVPSGTRGEQESEVMVLPGCICFCHTDDVCSNGFGARKVVVVVFAG